MPKDKKRKKNDFEGRLPGSDRTTTDVDEYCKAWYAVAQPIIDEFPAMNFVVYGFDPSVAYHYGEHGSGHLSIPISVHVALNERLHELQRLRKFFFKVVEKSKKKGFYDDIRKLIATIEKGEKR